MKLEIIAINKSLNPTHLRQSLMGEDITLFKNNFKTLFNKIDDTESEEYNKNSLADFLRDTYYKGQNQINTAGRKDLVIHEGTSNKTPVLVIIETKSPKNKSEMMTLEQPNAKALHEVIHYFLEERITNQNPNLRHIIVSNAYEWFVFDASEFEKYFYQNSKFRKKYQDWLAGKLSSQKTDYFYKEIAKSYLENDIESIQCTHIDLREYQGIVTQESEISALKLVNLYKIFSPAHLLKLPFSNDYNKIDRQFYNELLYVFGLEEVKLNGVKLIKRVREKKRQSGTFLENTINILQVRNKLSEVENLEFFGKNKEEQLFSVALELCITWLNRILFLKLLEGQLIKYHRNDSDYTFINSKKIQNLGELSELFFEVLAVKRKDRNQTVIDKFGDLPYLNSSLFEISELEKQTLLISDLKTRLEIPVFAATVLKEEYSGKKEEGKRNTLDYFLDFLSSYNFSSEQNTLIQTDKRTIINAAVLGLIFEKINGYKEGSFYTPSAITSYISHQSIRQVVVNRFNEVGTFGKIKDFDYLSNKIDYADKKERQEANNIVNSIKICDPAVGSGHFLVSVLNELIAIKSELRILQDCDKQLIREFHIRNNNDELEIIDKEKGDYFQYYLTVKGVPIPEIQALQKAIFYEKKTLIENCIFGVDINPKSVAICRLRLWIELLKNTFYTNESEFKELETLPNIDINIKTGNSLISKFDTGFDIFDQKSINHLIKTYKIVITEYKKVTDFKQKQQLRKQIKNIKSELEKFAIPKDKKYKAYLKKNKALGDLLNLNSSSKKLREQIVELTKEVTKLREDYEQNYKSVYFNSLEWSVEFPEILSDTGKFNGFDLVVGNPPYFSISKQQNLREVKDGYLTYKQTGDVYVLFIERGVQILKEGGILSFITSNKWMRAAYGASLRKFLLEKTKVEELIDFDGLKVFDEATVDTSIITLKKTNKKELFGAKVPAVRFDKTFNLEKGSISDFFDENKKTLSNLDAGSWNLTSEKENSIKNKIEKIGKPLNDWNINIFRGITTGLNEAFIIDTTTKNQLIKEDRKNKKLIKPILRGRDIKKYYSNFNDLWLLYIPWHFPLHNDSNIIGNSEIAEKKFANKYSSLYNLLSKNKEKLSNRNTSETGIRYEWYALQRSAATYYDEFEKEKIIFTKASQTKSFCYDDKGYFLQNTSYLLTGEHLKYLLALLNSKLISFAFMRFYQSGGIEGEITVQGIRKIPIPQITENNIAIVTELEKLVNKILSVKSKNSEADITKEQTKIDELVFELYELTEEEIKLVENGEVIKD